MKYAPRPPRRSRLGRLFHAFGVARYKGVQRPFQKILDPPLSTLLLPLIITSTSTSTWLACKIL